MFWLLGRIDWWKKRIGGVKLTRWQVLIIGVGLTVVFLWPVVTHFTTHLPSREDGLFIIWTIDWVREALVSGQNPFNAPIFWPLPNTLTYSDPFLSTGLLSIPLRPFVPNLIALHNLPLIIGSLTRWLTCYW